MRSGQPTRLGRCRNTLAASATAMQAVISATTRSAHHHPKYLVASRPSRANTPRNAPMPLRVPSPLRALLPKADPTRRFAIPRGVKTSTATPADTMAETELSGAEPSARASVAATTSTMAVTIRAADTTIDARASARSLASPWECFRWNRQTRLADPATSANTSNPRPRTPRLPASRPAVIDHAPVSVPQTTEAETSTSAFRWSAPLAAGLNDLLSSVSSTDQVSPVVPNVPPNESPMDVKPSVSTLSETVCLDKSMS